MTRIKRTVYRNRKTGRFVSRKTWQRSKSAGGTRYKLERQTVRRKPKRQPQVPPLAKIYEWLVTFTYEATGRSLDVIATGKDEEETEEAALVFLARDPNGRKIVDNIQHWTIRTARGKESLPHKPEYRKDSK